MKSIQYKPIGVIHSPFKDRTGIPHQAARAPEITAKIEIFKEYVDGLSDLDGFSHIIVIFHLHLIQKGSLKAHPPSDNQERGVFATRSPSRPNPIGISVVRLESIDRNILNISRVDMVDGTPVLDIKPFIPDLNPKKGIRVGWLKRKIKGTNKNKPVDR